MTIYKLINLIIIHLITKDTKDNKGDINNQVTFINKISGIIYSGMN